MRQNYKGFQIEVYQPESNLPAGEPAGWAWSAQDDETSLGSFQGHGDARTRTFDSADEALSDARKSITRTFNRGY